MLSGRLRAADSYSWCSQRGRELKRAKAHDKGFALWQDPDWACSWALPLLPPYMDASPRVEKSSMNR